MTDAVRQLIAVIDEYVGATEVSEKTLSFRIFGDSKTIGLLRNGSDITTGRLARAMEWLSDGWPDEASWPRSITRPRKSRSAA